MDKQEDLDRIYWACRRGMLELDLLFLPFVKSQYSQLNSTQRKCFQQLLTYPDPELYAWLIGSEPPPTEFQALVSLIKDFYVPTK